MPEAPPNSSASANYQTGQKIALAGMFVSGALAVAKLAGGLISGSTALMADGLESAGDVLASAIIYGGMTIAQRPPDSRFPYGYGRAESLAGKTVGTILLMSAALLCTHSIHRLFSPPTTLPAWTLIPLAISFIAKAIMSVIKFTAGRRFRSSALIADAANDSVDIISATVAMAAIGLVLVGGPRFAIADPLGGVAVSLIIFFLGINIFRRTSRELMDEMPAPALVAEVIASATAEPGVLAVEKCFGRKSGTQFFIDLHIEVHPDMTVHDAHELAHRVKDRILRDCVFVRDVLVHVEPH